MNPDLERLMNDFVPRIGGEVVSRLIEKPDFRNADYIFREDGVVAELKCLQKDLFRSPDIEEKVSRMHQRWVNEGLVPPLPRGRFAVRSDSLPESCRAELEKVARRPIKEAVQKANRQIKETKQKFDIQSAKGLLILVNDGNYSLESQALVSLLAAYLRPRLDKDNNPTNAPYSSIDSVVCFTWGMPSLAPRAPQPVDLWLDSRRDSCYIPREFLTRFREGWFNYVADLSGTPTVAYAVDDPELIVDLAYTQAGRKPPRGPT